MSNIPEVKLDTSNNVKFSFDREGKKYIEKIVDESLEKQPILTCEISELLSHIDDKLKGKINDSLRDDVIETVGFMAFAILKSLYIQEEVNELCDGDLDEET